MNIVVARAVVLGLLCSVVAPALAQDAGSVADPAERDTGALEEAVVTAQKRDTNLQDTPISIAVLTADGLANRQAISLASLSDGSVPSLDANQAQFRQVFETLATQPEGAVLFHCIAGTDRTGMVAALLLSLAGVPRRDIVHDYAISAHYLEPMMSQSPQMAAMARQNPKMSALMGSPAAAIESFLDALERRHGGAQAYLRRIGVSEADIGSLMARLGQLH